MAIVGLNRILLLSHSKYNSPMCRRLKMQRGRLDLVVIDYLQLITPSEAKKSTLESVTKISRDIKIMAKELKVPIVILSQMSRSSKLNTATTSSLSALLAKLATIFITNDVLPQPGRAARTIICPGKKPLVASSRFLKPTLSPP